MPKMYTVQSGDYLWRIAEKIYGSGYNWVDLANANHLQNPGVIYAGTKLIVPNVAPKMPTVQTKPVQVQNPITGEHTRLLKAIIFGISQSELTETVTNGLKSPKPIT